MFANFCRQLKAADLATAAVSNETGANRRQKGHPEVQTFLPNVTAGKRPLQTAAEARLGRR